MMNQGFHQISIEKPVRVNEHQGEREMKKDALT